MLVKLKDSFSNNYSSAFMHCDFHLIDMDFSVHLTPTGERVALLNLGHAVVPLS